MSTIFTDFVRDFETERENHGRVIEAIRNVLVKELRRRGIFQYGPSMLGYRAGRSWDDESLHDLAYDCLDRAIVAKRRGLLGLLQKPGSIDGVVVQNIRYFVGERQKLNDPVGSAVFQNLKAVLTEFVADGRMRTLHTGSATEKGVQGNSEFATGADQGPLATELQIKNAMYSSGSMLDELPALATVGIKAQEILTEALCRLKDSGIASFSVQTMKRAICSLITESGAPVPTTRLKEVEEPFEDFFEKSRTVLPDTGYEDTESVEHFIRQMHGEIHRCHRSSAVRNRLCRLLDLAYEARAGRIPIECISVTELQSTLGIERTTVYDDVEYLGSIGQRVMAQHALDRKNGDQNG